MDTVENSFLIRLPEKYKKYGITNNIKARLAYEVFHDLDLAAYFMRKDPKTYFYFLKRCISRGNFSLFKRLFKSVTWTSEHNLALKKLFYAANYYHKSSFMKFIYDNSKKYLDFTHKEWIYLYLYSSTDKITNFIFKNELINFEEFKRISMSTWTNLLVFFSDHEKVMYLYDNLFNINREIKNPMNIREVAELFGYEYNGKKQN